MVVLDGHLMHGLAAALSGMAIVFLFVALHRSANDRLVAADTIEDRIRGGMGSPDAHQDLTGGDGRTKINFVDQARAVGMSSGMLATIGLLGAVAAGVGLWALIEAPLLTFLASAGGALGGPLLVVRFRQQQRLAQLNTQFQSALEQMVAGLRAGATLHQAFEHVATESPEPLRAEFRSVARLMGLRPADEAVRVLSERIPTREVEIFTSAVGFHAQTGGSLADVLLRVADLVRERQTFQKQVSALTAEGRMTTWLIAGMPIFLLGAFRVMVPEYLSEVVASIWGQLIIGVALGMVAVGVIIINRMIVGLTRGAG